VTELATLNFHGAALSVLADDKGEWVFPGQLCRNMGIDDEAQRKLIKRSHWSEGWTSVMQVQLPGDVQVRPQFALHSRRFAMWMATITSSRLKDDAVRARVEQYQTEAADVLADWLERRHPPKDLSRKEILRMALDAEEALEAAEKALKEADTQRATLDARNRALTAAKRELAAVVEQDRPKVDSYEQLMTAEGTYSFAEAAKMLPVPLGQNRLYDLLREKGLVRQGKREPYQEYVDRGYFTLVAHTYQSNHGPVATSTPRITPRGLEYIRRVVIGA
jgi:phage antirepressor YoqD-like protein